MKREIMAIVAACPSCTPTSLSFKSAIVEMVSVYGSGPLMVAITAVKHYTSNAETAAREALSGGPVTVTLEPKEAVAAAIILGLAKYGVVSRLDRKGLMEDMAKADTTMAFYAVKEALTVLNQLAPAPMP